MTGGCDVVWQFVQSAVRAVLSQDRPRHVSAWTSGQIPGDRVRVLVGSRENLSSQVWRQAFVVGHKALVRRGLRCGAQR